MDEGPDTTGQALREIIAHLKAGNVSIDNAVTRLESLKRAHQERHRLESERRIYRVNQHDCCLYLNVSALLASKAVFVRLTFLRPWYSRWLLEGPSITLPAVWMEGDRPGWRCDASSWVRREKLSGYSVQIQPFCQDADDTHIILPSTLVRMRL